MIDYAKLLNKEQFEAATAGDGPLLVLAAAGTGKTRTLVYRVAYLKERGVPPDRMLLLTFTNRAAREMMERARALAGEDAGTVWSGTFHHVCNRFLRRFADRVGYARDFVIMDRDDSRRLIEQCIKAVVKDKKEFPKKDVIASLIGTAANRRLGVEELLESRVQSLRVDPGEILAVTRLYGEKKLEMGAMDFDDLLVNGLRLLEEDPRVRDYYQNQFLHVLVDEYQDTNLLQARMVDILAAKSRNVMAVGDDFQCIYSWRGANFKNIMEFPGRWPGCRIVKLEQNYRSVPEVLEVANSCIRGNPDQFQKTLRPTRPPRRRPSVYFLREGNEQARAVLGMVRRYREDGYRLGDMAVLYRAHFHALELEMCLGRAGIPYSITSGLRIYEQRHIKDVLAFLRVCTAPSDKLAFTRLTGLLHGVGEKSSEAFWRGLGGRFDIRDPAARARLAGMMRPAAKGQWKAIDGLFGELLDKTAPVSGGELIERFFEVFYRGYVERAFEDAESREEDIHELSLQVSASPSLEAFLQEVALQTNVDREYDRMADAKKKEEDRDQLHLSTVHQAKGLEWPVVFIIWAAEGMFPSSKSCDENGDDSEERRLFYVAVTRAKDELVLCAPSMRMTRDGSCFFCKPSRFIKEVPKELLSEHYGFREF